jgi:hypothetical protein
LRQTNNLKLNLINFQSIAFPRLKMDSELFAVEDEKLELKCIIYGSMIKEDEIHWYYGKI